MNNSNNSHNGQPTFYRTNQPPAQPPAQSASQPAAIDADDPTDLPLFARHEDSHPAGRVRSDFSLRPLVPEAPGSAEAAAPAGPRHAAPARPVERRPVEEGEVNWDLVAEYRDEASSRLTARLERQGGRVTEDDRHQIGIAVITELLKSEAEERVSSGRPAWSTTEEAALQKALEDALFGLGRLQPLVENDDLENIIIIARGEACTVWLETTDGTLLPGPRVADSEDELRELLVDLGARQNRPFSEARPSLHLRLPGGARLAAASWVTAKTSVVIRRHRLVEVSMEEMIHTRKACGPVLANFLSACVRAGKSIVVSGVQGSGKTTWVRALCSQIPPHEKIGTFETEFELHLHDLTARHHIVHAWEHRPGSGEVGIDGRQAGQFTLEEAIHDSFRFTLDRQIVGEVRGPEVWNMLKAMESGPGSISTTHARSADHTIEKLVSCAMEMGPQVTRELAISKLAAAIDIVMHLRVEVTENTDGTFRKRRWVEEVLVVEPSPDATKGYSTTQVFKPGPGGHAVASGELPDRMRDELLRYGFDIEAYNAEGDAYGAQRATGGGVSLA